PSAYRGSALRALISWRTIWLTRCRVTPKCSARRDWSPQRPPLPATPRLINTRAAIRSFSVRVSSSWSCCCSSRTSEVMLCPPWERPLAAGPCHVLRPPSTPPGRSNIGARLSPRACAVLTTFSEDERSGGLVLEQHEPDAGDGDGRPEQHARRHTLGEEQHTHRQREHGRGGGQKCCPGRTEVFHGIDEQHAPDARAEHARRSDDGHAARRGRWRPERRRGCALREGDHGPDGDGRRG